MKCQYIEAPNYEDIINKTNSIFLGGGITNCENWQTDVIKSLEDFDNLTILNPRRKNFEMFKNEAGFVESKKQIEWEEKYIGIANTVVFWFSKETIQPITLFELGVIIERWRKNKDFQHVIIGCHNQYPRKFDVQIQVELKGYGYPIYDTFEKFVNAVVISQKTLKTISNRSKA